MTRILYECVAAARIIGLADTQVAAQPIVLPEALVSLTLTLAITPRLIEVGALFFGWIAMCLPIGRVHLTRIVVVRFLASHFSTLMPHVVLLACAPLLETGKLALLSLMIHLQVLLLITLRHDDVLYFEMSLLPMASLLRRHVVARRSTFLVHLLICIVHTGSRLRLRMRLGTIKFDFARRHDRRVDLVGVARSLSATQHAVLDTWILMPLPPRAFLSCSLQATA